MSIFALVDCNNFYASCERVFNPRLENKPIVVLSNNDGCVISRSSEAKKLRIPMGAPYFKWQKFCKENNVNVFSSNYELYGDLSSRVMMTLRFHCPQIEIYSIDEAFLMLDDLANMNIPQYMEQVKKAVKKWTGIPVSVGIASSKTLAKIANHIAKNNIQENVYQIVDSFQDTYFHGFPVEKIWGIGSQNAKRLHKLNIFNAEQLRDADPKMIRTHFNVVTERVVLELRGTSCLSLETMIEPRKQIICSRSFGKPVNTLTELEEAVSHYGKVASKKLREQKCLTGGIYVFLETNFFNQHDPYYSNCIYAPFRIPTIDTRYIIRMAKKCIKHLYKQNHHYHKAGIILTELIPDSMQQCDMLDAINGKSELLMQSIDAINKKFGKEAVFYCAEGIKRTWKMQANLLSPRYTTRWKELLKV